MKETKNTDELIKAKLENYSVTPPPHIWQQVQQQLDGHKKRVWLSWIRVAAVAAVIVLAFAAGWYFKSNSENLASTGLKTGIQNNTEVQQNNNLPAQEAKTENSEIQKLADNWMVKPGIHPGKTLTLSKHTVNASNVVQRVNPIAVEKLNYRTIRWETTQPDLVTVEEKELELLTPADLLVIAGNIENEKSVKKEKTDKWKMGMFLSPGYSSYSASYADDYSSNMTYSGSNGNANMGGGISIQYKTGKKWAVESGVYYAQNGQKSENSLNLFASKENADYVYTPGSSSGSFVNNVRLENGNLAMNSSAGIIEFTSTPKGAELSGNFDSSISGSTNLIVPNGEFSQVFEFVEIPLYVRYYLLQSRFGLQMLTGFNTSMVVGNNAYINNLYGMQNVGKTADINTFNLAATAGLGASYELSHHFSLALEPRFSYFLNSINKNPDVLFRPYRLGIYAGMTYTF